MHEGVELFLPTGDGKEGSWVVSGWWRDAAVVFTIASGRGCCSEHVDVRRVRVAAVGVDDRMVSAQLQRAG